MGTRGSFPGVKRVGSGADHPPQSSAEVQNAYSYTSILILYIVPVYLWVTDIFVIDTS
jgi:hypothetical protein